METIKSILPQADSIKLFLNSYSFESAEQLCKINPQKITYVVHDNRYGDAGKFYWAKISKGYVFTGDDDMIFPPDYVARTIAGIEKYGRNAVVSHHGRTMDFPITSYYGGEKQYYSFTGEVKQDTKVDVIGTGCLAWHSDTIQPVMEDFPTANMADIHFSILAKKQNIPLMVLAHKNNWIWYQNPSETIFSKKSKDDSEHVHRLNGAFANLTTVK